MSAYPPVSVPTVRINRRWSMRWCKLIILVCRRNLFVHRILRAPAGRRPDRARRSGEAHVLERVVAERHLVVVVVEVVLGERALPRRKLNAAAIAASLSLSGNLPLSASAATT